MTIGLLFWLLMILWIAFSVFYYRGELRGGNYGVLGLSLFVFILLFLLGWRVFGFIVQG